MDDRCSLLARVCWVIDAEPGDTCPLPRACFRTVRLLPVTTRGVASMKNADVKAPSWKRVLAAVGLFVLLCAITPLLLYLGVSRSGCTELDRSKPFLSLSNLRNCVFSKDWPPEPLAPWRIHDWMPTEPLTAGLSSTFNPTTACPRLQALQLEKVRHQLRFWNEKSITSADIEHGYREEGFWGGGRFRVQIIGGKVYAVPPACCPGAPRHSKCCAPRLGPREKYTLGQLWALVSIFGDSIPDVDFLLNTRDEPSGLEPQNRRSPIFAYSLLKRGRAVAVPYKSDRTPTTGMGIAKPWKDRQSKAVWRGGPTGFDFNWKHAYGPSTVTSPTYRKAHARIKLCRFAGRYPDLIDVAFASPMMVLWPEQPVPCRVSKKSDPTELAMDYREQQSSFKYIVDVPGFSWSSRLKDILMLDMVVLKMEDPFNDFVFQFLERNTHYISVDTNLSNLAEKIEWAKMHDDEARKIAAASSDVLRDYLSFDASLCYWQVLLMEYAALQASPPRLHEHAREIGREPEEWNLSEMLFFVLAGALTLLVYICILNGSWWRGSARKKVYHAIPERDLNV